MNAFLLRAADWWLGTAIGGGLVLLVGCVLMRLARQPAARQRLGELAVFAALLVAGLRLLPAWMPVDWAAAKQEEPNPPSPFPKREGGEDLRGVLEGSAVLEFSPPSRFGKGDGGLGLEPPAPDSVTIEETFPAWSWHDAAAWLTAAYLLIAAALAARWLLGQWALNRLLRQARPAAPRVLRLFTAMAAGAFSTLPRLRLSRRLRAPVCFGLRRPAVLLPEPMEDAADAELRWVFAHELTHLRRRDPWSSWGLGLAQAVYFFLPWFWWLRRQVRLCQEYVADAAAAGAGPAADEYAEFLVSLARGTAAPLGATGLGTSSDLLRRVQMLLQSKTPVQGSWPRGRSLVAAGGLLTVAIFAGGVGLRAEPPKEEPKPGERNDVVIFKYDSDAPTNYMKRLAALPADPLAQQDGDRKTIRVIVLDSDGEDKPAENKPAKNGEKKTERMTIIIDTGDGQIKIPIDPNSEDLGKEIQKAIQKARAQSAADKQQRAQAIEKALESLKGELTDEQIKQLRKQLEAMRASKGPPEAPRAMTIVGTPDGKRVWAGGQTVTRGLGVGVPLPPAAAWGNGGDVRYMAVTGAGRLGARIEPPSPALADQLDLPKGQGLVIAEVFKDTPAAKAGLKSNDVLLELAGKPVSSDPAHFMKWIHEIKADEEVTAVVLRKGHKEKIGGLKMPEAPDGPVQMWRFQPAPDGRRIEIREDPRGKGEAPDRPSPKSPSPAPQSVSIRVNDGNFTAEQTEGDVAIRVTGKMDSGKVAIDEIQIATPDGKNSCKGLSEVPEKHRDAVKRLISNIDGTRERLKYHADVPKP